MSFRSSLAQIADPPTGLGTKDPRYLPLVIEHVRAGNYQLRWLPLKTEIPAKGSAPAHSATFYVMADALTIEGVRVTVDAWTHQILCDLIGCSMLTAKASDLIWYKRDATLAPVILSQTPQQVARMTYIATLLLASKDVDDLVAQLPAQSRNGILSSVGKHWILRNSLATSPHKGCNYGVYSATAPHQCVTVVPGVPCKLFQQPGTYHPAQGEPDYSQIFRAMLFECTVDGVPRDLLDVFADPELAPLVSDEGVVRVVRQPGVPAPKGPAITLPTSPLDASKCPDVGLGRLVGVKSWPRSPLPPAVSAWLQTLASLPLGAVARDTVGGLPFVARVECGGDKGTTGLVVYQPAAYDAKGVLVTRTAPPPGWPGS